MAINFNRESVFNLSPINLSDVRDEVNGLLIENEHMICAFKTVRDQLIFTDFRIIAVDVQGITGKRKSFSSLPYSKVQFFSIQTPGFAELVPDSELYMEFANGFTAKFEFRGGVDIGQIGRMISEFVLSV
jgi:hypothetical protein